MVSRNYICLISLTIGGFIGIIIGALFFSGVLPEITLAIYAVLAISVALILYLIVSLSNSSSNNIECFQRSGPCLLLGAIGTLILSIIALALSLTAGDILGSIIIGLITFFFTFAIVSTIFLIICLLNTGDEDNNENGNCNCNIINSLNSNGGCRFSRNRF